MPYLVDPAAQAARRRTSLDDAVHARAVTPASDQAAVCDASLPVEPASRAGVPRALAQSVARKIDAAREAERTRLAQEMHDGLGAHLTALQLTVARLTMRPPANPAEWQSLCAQIQHAASAAQDAAHELVGRHRPPALDAGLVAALRAWLRGFGEQSGLTCIWRCDDVTRERVARLTPEAVLALYRIAQEALTNVARHARASRVVVALDGSHRSLKLTVCDDGCGLARGARRKQGHFGLIGMRERCTALGGTLRIGGGEGSGTLVSARLPWHQILPAPAGIQALQAPESLALHGYAS
ncbi:sensor histidine kinase [Pandoraea nosoerga]|uniref:Sensor histidine kinase n=1 Tax=Pandoraea nosoerga TaxID=2508296 RepID=A0A5E4XZ25_9BURK|nr:MULTISPECIES: sensor histidine kinase [Pandoraea]MBN4664783.1 sensor histidine kinase [Pandoraea nosoerga]MBN4674043.1 sensor histidine kinase [Pandoraea nosoerga]MBN4680023.1 sensor histidine kinase [Pandoraea nosoerga]MBN4747266.1 sensor histidine kinase [Pandoraea nosoerga]VVE41298.1 sensor histidine kinase [Pandoraea nosoerga]